RSTSAALAIRSNGGRNEPDVNSIMAEIALPVGGHMAVSRHDSNRNAGRLAAGTEAGRCSQWIHRPAARRQAIVLELSAEDPRPRPKILRRSLSRLMPRINSPAAKKECWEITFAG